MTSVSTIVFLVIFSLECKFSMCAFPRPSRPHVVFFIIDDLGWSDVGYRHGSDISGATPVIDSLASSGILLDRYYLQPVCSPSRAAFMQGRYPWKTGMQHFNTLYPASTAAMPMNQPTMGEIFSENGYHTVSIGKWHLGYAHWDNTPTGRGFKSHMGYYQGEIDYYTKYYTIDNRILPFFNISGLDWWVNRTSTKNENSYSKELFDSEMTRFMSSYTPSEENPLFLYYANQIAHVPLDNPPEIFYENCTHLQDSTRRTYCAMLAAIDDSLKKLISELTAKGMWDNTILVVTSDNGGMPKIDQSIIGSAGVNYPLRGGKGTAFEGGVRGIGFVNGGDHVIPKEIRGTVVNDLLHAVDWLPTLANMAAQQSQKNVPLPSNLDGYDLWDVLANNAQIPRKSLPVNINYNVGFPSTGHQIALISQNISGAPGTWKFILSEISGPVFNYDGWYPAPPQNPIPPPVVPPWDSPYRFLFNIDKDPNEQDNVYYMNPGIVSQFQNLLELYSKEYVSSQFNLCDPLGFPELHGGVWAPFLG